MEGVWEASGSSPYGGSWEAACAVLQAAGFDAVFPCVQYGPVARWDASGIPVSPDMGGDPLQACLDAAHSRDMAVHAWVVLWKLSWLDPAASDSFRAIHPTQVGVDGSPSDWLCPTDPANRALEIRILREMAERYPLDGLNLDFVRFPDGDHCYCQGCRTRFEQHRGAVVEDWPREVYFGGSLHDEYWEWRRSAITSFVSQVSEVLSEASPDLVLSVDVIPDTSEARGNCGQDWPAWCRDGTVDLLVPMNYTGSADSLAAWTRLQAGIAGEVPVAAGIGAFSTGAEMTAPQLVEQVGAAMDAGAVGWVVFQYCDRLASILGEISGGLGWAADRRRAGG